MISGGDAAVITGKWMNKYSGEIINVKNSIMSGNNMIVLTDMGEIDMAEFSKNFVQMPEDKLYNNSGQALSNEESRKIKEQQQKEQEQEEKFEFNQDFPEELLKKIEEEEDDVYSTLNPSTEISETKEKQSAKTHKQSKSISRQKLEKEDLIRPIFEKIGINPKINFSIECENFPTTQFNMLKEFFGVTEADIANYIIHYIISDEDFVESVENFVKNKMI